LLGAPPRASLGPLGQGFLDNVWPTKKRRWDAALWDNNFM